MVVGGRDSPKATGARESCAQRCCPPWYTTIGSWPSSTSPLIVPPSFFERILAPARAPSADPVRTRAAESKAIQEEIKAKTARLDFEERMGRLIPVDVAMDQNRRQASRTLEAILRLPMEAAEEANPDDPARARAAMQRHIRLILEQFAAAGMAEIEQARILLQSAEVDVHA